MKTKKVILSGVTKPVKKSKFVASNTLRINYEDGTESVRLRDTDVVTFKPGEIVLNSGGWKTVATKDRMNQFSSIRVRQDKGVWYANGKAFYDGMVFNDAGELISPPIDVDFDFIKQMKKKINKFCSLITKENLPVPSNGDCWFCLMRTEDGETMGDSSKNHDHLVDHMEEGYLHGSLLVNAMRERGYKDEQIGFHYQLRVVDTFKRAVRRYLQKRLIPGIAVK